MVGRKKKKSCRICKREFSGLADWCSPDCLETLRAASDVIDAKRNHWPSPSNIYGPRRPTRGERRKLKFKQKKERRAHSLGFYDSKAWKKLRFMALSLYGRVCMCCQSVRGPFHVDHIRPRSKFPHLELRFDNLQVLCESCNVGKSNNSFQDFRTAEQVVHCSKYLAKGFREISDESRPTGKPLTTVR